MAVRQIENEALCVSVEDKGAEMVSVIEKNSGRERIWNADPKVWNRHAPILFPFVGTVADGVYRHGGKEYPMKSRHGFARDSVFACTGAMPGQMSHVLVSDAHTKEIYPFDFELRVTHLLDSENPRMLTVRWEVRNTGSDRMYYSIGGHPAFAVPGREGEERADYFLYIPGRQELNYYLVNMESGLFMKDKSYRLPLDHGLVPIAPDMFDRDALVLEDVPDVLGIASPGQKPFVTMHCEGFTHAGIWSAPKGNFVCLEPWMGRTDNEGFTGTLEEKPGICSLAAGEAAEYHYTVEFHEGEPS